MTTSKIYALPQTQTNLPVSANSTEVEWDDKYKPDNGHYCENYTAEMNQRIAKLGQSMASVPPALIPHHLEP